MSAIDNAHALVIGIANYQHINRLPETVLKDVRDVHALLVDAELCGYPEGNAVSLLDGQATQAAIRQALAGLAACTDGDSTVFFYISSHGGQIEGGPYAGEYLLPVDTVYQSDESLAQTAISGAEFTGALRAIPARKVVVVFDCCHSGGIGQPKDAAAPGMKALPESYYDALKGGRGRVILASSRSTEYSYVMPGAENSLFTQHLLAGLRGGAPAPGGVIRVFDVFDYVQPRVVRDQPKQHPIFKAEIEENFPIALYLGGKAATPVPTASPEDEYDYDVFVSYYNKKADRTWVRETLLPRLKDEGLRTLTEWEFPLGVPKVENIEHAVTHSRYTLAVLTPSYLDSTWWEDRYESVMAESLGAETAQNRLLPILREECIPRLGIRMRELLDMSDDDDFEMNVARLVYQLRQPPLRRRR